MSASHCAFNTAAQPVSQAELWLLLPKNPPRAEDHEQETALIWQSR